MIPNEVGWHYIAVTKLWSLSRGVTSTHNGNFYCSNCPHSFWTKNKLESHKKVCKDKDGCCVWMPSKKYDVKLSQYRKSTKVPSVISAVLKHWYKK